VVLAHFNGINQDLVETAWEFNRSSLCYFQIFQKKMNLLEEYKEAIRL